jgi:hypothetical protein
MLVGGINTLAASGANYGVDEDSDKDEEGGLLETIGNIL